MSTVKKSPKQEEAQPKRHKCQCNVQGARARNFKFGARAIVELSNEELERANKNSPEGIDNFTSLA